MATHWNVERYQTRHSYVYSYGEAVVDLLAPQKGERILDLGCGSGQLTAKIAEAGAIVVGLDSSPEMIAEARAKVTGGTFRLGDAAEFTVEQPFDAVFSNAALHWVKDQEGVARSVARALKPSGRFVAEMGGHGNVAVVLRGIREVLGPIEHPWTFPSIGECAPLLEKHGLEVQYAALIDRPTRVEGADGMEDWLAMYANSFVTRDQARAVAERLRDVCFDGAGWTMDYRRLRFVAAKRLRVSR